MDIGEHKHLLSMFSFYLIFCQSSCVYITTTESPIWPVLSITGLQMNIYTLLEHYYSIHSQAPNFIYPR